MYSANSHCFRLRQKRIFRLFEAQAPLAQLAVENRARLLPQVGNLEDVAEDVVAVVPQQRVGVEHDRAHRADEHHVQADVIEQPRLAEPPDERADRGQHELDVHARRADRRAMPPVGQHPRVGDVAVQAGREHQQHHAHLVALAAEVLARQAVAELVQDLGRRQRDRRATASSAPRRTSGTTAAAIGRRRTARCTSVSAASASSDAADHRRHGEEPANVRVDAS